ncbi:MAG: DNA mismatch repair protein MutS, partial [Candidatus Eisenbacteria bacterium]|nr:DNA mismatch repair protein MutS [Candidatus Eisenbacteria bacterium]
MKPTPVMSQYLRLKQQAGEAILFFRMGDFYEMFMEDAVEAAALLDLTLTSRDKQAADPVPMAGVPWHSAGPHIAKLLKAGRRVALCEQIERPGTRGLMDREIVEILTPGTAVGEELLDGSRSLYLAALALERGVWGLAVADISTGEFALGECGAEGLGAELAKQGPREILLAAAIADHPAVREHLRDHPEAVATRLDDWAFSASRGRRLLEEHFGVATLEPFGVGAYGPALAAGGALLAYAREQRRSPLAHLKPPRRLRDADSLWIDETTLRNLEVLEPAPGRGGQSLLGVLDATRTAMGQRALRRALGRPLMDPAAIRARHAAVEALIEAPEPREALRRDLRGIADLERIVGRLHCGRARPQELGRLRDALLIVPRLAETARDLAQRGGFPPAPETGGAVALGAELDRALADASQLAAGEALIRPGYDAQLDEQRALGEEGDRWVAEFQERERRDTG